jgi:PKD repeat protein
VSPGSIAADFTFSPTNPSITSGTNTVIFDATPSSAGVTAWTWDFGDGTAAGVAQRVSHTFSRPGTWIVRLTVTDSAGRTATTTKQVPVVQ